MNSKYVEIIIKRSNLYVEAVIKKKSKSAELLPLSRKVALSAIEYYNYIPKSINRYPEG